MKRRGSVRKWSLQLVEPTQLGAKKQPSAQRTDTAPFPKRSPRLGESTKRYPQKGALSPVKRAPRAKQKKGPFLSEWALGSASVRSVWSRTDTQGRMGPHLRPCCEPTDKLAKNAKSTIEPTPFSDSCLRPSVWVAQARRGFEIRCRVRTAALTDEDVLGDAVVRSSADLERARSLEWGLSASVDTDLEMEKDGLTWFHSKCVLIPAQIEETDAAHRGPESMSPGGYLEGFVLAIAVCADVSAVDRGLHGR